MISEHRLLIRGIILQGLEGLDLFLLQTAPDQLFCPLWMVLGIVQTAPDQLFCPLWMVLGIVVSFSVNNLKLHYCWEVLHLTGRLKIGRMGFQHCCSCSKGCSQHLKWSKVAKGLLWCLEEFGAKEHSCGVPGLTLWTDNSQYIFTCRPSLCDVWHVAQHSITRGNTETEEASGVRGESSHSRWPGVWSSPSSVWKGFGWDLTHPPEGTRQIQIQIPILPLSRLP